MRRRDCGARDDGDVQVDDLALWKAIVQRRDREAFEVLYRRHARIAQNVAYCIVKNHELAGEAVQEPVATPP